MKFAWEDHSDKLEKLVDRMLPDPDERTPGAHIAILVAFDSGQNQRGKSSKSDGQIAMRLLMAIEEATRCLDQLSSEARSEILASADKDSPNKSSYFMLTESAMRLGPAAREYSEKFVGGELRHRAQAAAVAEACRSVWKWRTGKDAPEEIHGTDQRTEFERFVTGVFEILPLRVQAPQGMRGARKRRHQLSAE